MRGRGFFPIDGNGLDRAKFTRLKLTHAGVKMPQRAAPIVALMDQHGELHRVQQQRTPGTTYGARFMIVFDEARQQIVTKAKSFATLKVWMILPDHLDWIVWRRLPQKELAAKLSISIGSINAAMAELLAIGAVEKRGAGPVIEWRLSLDWGWRGTPDQYHAARKARIAQEVKTSAQPSVAEGILWKERMRRIRLNGSNTRRHPPGRHPASPRARSPPAGPSRCCRRKTRSA